MNLIVKYSSLCDMIWNSACNRNKRCDVLLAGLKLTNNFSANQEKIVRNKLTLKFLNKFHGKWEKATHRRDLFLKKEEKFLAKDFIVEFTNIPSTSSVTNSPESNILNKSLGLQQTKRGRPRLSYDKGSQVTKRRRISEIATLFSKEELLCALKKKERMKDTAVRHESGEDHEYDTDTECEQDTECDEDSECDEDLEYDESSSQNIHDILAMYMDLGLSKNKYNKLRKHTVKIHNVVYPPYSHIALAKKSCYPDHIEISKTGAEVHFISLLAHTTERILLSLTAEDFKSIKSDELRLIGKWGMDGFTGQQDTRQEWSSKNDVPHENSTSDTNVRPTDKNVLLISFAPLQLRAGNKILWQNRVHSSINYCRPVEFEFTRETSDTVIDIYNRYSDLLKKVETYSLTVKKQLFKLKFDLKCTMIDGKMCNFLTNQSASNCCNICRVSPKNINDIDHVLSLKYTDEHFHFGLSTLHSWIKCLEYVLHISYKIGCERIPERQPRKENKRLKKGEGQFNKLKENGKNKRNKRKK